jgi:hypothetical protein
MKSSWNNPQSNPLEDLIEAKKAIMDGQEPETIFIQMPNYTEHVSDEELRENWPPYMPTNVEFCWDSGRRLTL